MRKSLIGVKNGATAWSECHRFYKNIELFNGARNSQWKPGLCLFQAVTVQCVSDSVFVG